MAQIKPFRGIRYNQSKVSLDEVTAPPYDIISPAEQGGYYARSVFNIVRLDFGKILPTDNDSENRYTRAAADLTEWRQTGILQQDDDPALYVYRQNFVRDGVETQITGIVCLVKLTEFGEDVLPHEKTLAGPKKDRRQLLAACQANFSQVFALYSDRTRTIEGLLRSVTAATPEMETTDSEQVVHQVWSTAATEVIEVAAKVLTDQRLVIADGHHRYETSLNYMKEMQDNGEARDSHGYIMMFLVDMANEDLVILPTHRVVKKADFNLDHFLDQMKGTVEVTEGAWVPRGAEEAAQDDREVRFGLYASGRLFSLTGDRKALSALLSENNSSAWRRLDTTILQETVLGPHLGVESGDGSLSFTQSDEEARRRVDSNEASLAILLEPMLMEQVEAVAEAGDKMPQKSTYFYPKPRTGLILRDME